MIGDTDNCPKCGSDELYRSRAKTRRERALRSLLPLHFYRCVSCGWREPLVSAATWREWRRRLAVRIAPILLGLVLIAGLLYLSFEGSRVLKPTRPAKSAGRKR